MIEFAVYRTDTGEILRYMTSTTGDSVPDQCSDGEEFYLNLRPASEATHIINDEPVCLPAAAIEPCREEVLAAKLAELAERVKLAAGAGIRVSERVYRTDPESITYGMCSYAAVKNGWATSGIWRTQEGGVVLGLDEVEGVITEVNAHLIKCAAWETKQAAHIKSLETASEILLYELPDWCPGCE